MIALLSVWESRMAEGHAVAGDVTFSESDALRHFRVLNGAAGIASMRWRVAP